MKRAVYAGTFDPVTKGHLWVIEQAASVFDELIVAIGVNPEKRTLFSVEQRLEMLQASLLGYTNVRFSSFENQYLVDYANEIGARHMVRGIRNIQDFGYEQVLRNINADRAPEVTTVYLMPPRELGEVSSSMVKGLIGPVGWKELLERYVPMPVMKAFLEKDEKS